MLFTGSWLIIESRDRLKTLSLGAWRDGCARFRTRNLKPASHGDFVSGQFVWYGEIKDCDKQVINHLTGYNWKTSYITVVCFSLWLEPAAGHIWPTVIVRLSDFTNWGINLNLHTTNRKKRRWYVVQVLAQIWCLSLLNLKTWTPKRRKDHSCASPPADSTLWICHRLQISAPEPFPGARDKRCAPCVCCGSDRYRARAAAVTFPGLRSVIPRRFYQKYSVMKRSLDDSSLSHYPVRTVIYISALSVSAVLCEL